MKRAEEERGAAVGSAGLSRCRATTRRLAARLRVKRRGQAGTQWHADDTPITVNARRCSRYRVNDRHGHLVEALLRDKRDRAAVQRCCAQSPDSAGHAPESVAADEHDTYPRAIRETVWPGGRRLVSSLAITPRSTGRSSAWR